MYAHLGHGVAHVRDRPVDGGADLELHHHVRLALDRPGGDAVDVADAGDRTLDLLHHLRLELLRRRPGLTDAHVHGRERDIGIGRHREAHEGDHAHEQQHHEQHDRGQRVADGPR